MAARALLLRLTVLAGLCACAVVPAQETTPVNGVALITALRGGGFNLYFRHAQTDWSQFDQVNSASDWSSCDPTHMRQLSVQGRDTMRAVGDVIRSLAIPIGRVLASPYCRTMQSAQLLGLGPVQASLDVINMRVADYFGGRQVIIDSARALLATPPAAGSNTVIVAHGNVARLSTPVYPGEAEAVVFLPDGRGGFSVFARIPAARWQSLDSDTPP